jgi:hypothetical protein
MKTLEEFQKEQAEFDRKWKEKGHEGVGWVACEEALYKMFVLGFNFSRRLGRKDCTRPELQKALREAAEAAYSSQDVVNGTTAWQHPKFEPPVNA